MSSTSFIKTIGVELEYMIVDSKTLAIKPICDKLLRSAASSNSWESEVVLGPITWSNELVSHVVELKVSQPVSSTTGLASQFQESINKALDFLAPFNARLMPTAMHPWMDPEKEAVIWPHEGHEVYQEFNRVFDCRTHGWANLQSIHINLPFNSEEEFSSLMAAIRFLLPILPGLAASSPIIGGEVTGLMDNRLDVYRGHTRKIRSLTGRVIPEPIYSKTEYQQKIFQKIYQDLERLVPSGLLSEEWANARGAIPRFCRNTIEIRVLDVQENPAADLAIVAAIVDTIVKLVEGSFITKEQQMNWATAELEQIFLLAIIDADQAIIANREYLSAFGISAKHAEIGQIWQHILASTDLLSDSSEHSPALNNILNNGALSRRMRKSLVRSKNRKQQDRIYRDLCNCLSSGSLFTA